MSSYRPSPLAALLNGLGGSLPDFTNALVKRKWASQDAQAALEEKLRAESAKTAETDRNDRRDAAIWQIRNAAGLTGEQAIGAEGAMADANWDSRKALGLEDDRANTEDRLSMMDFNSSLRPQSATRKPPGGGMGIERNVERLTANPVRSPVPDAAERPVAKALGSELYRRPVGGAGVWHETAYRKVARQTFSDFARTLGITENVLREQIRKDPTVRGRFALQYKSALKSAGLPDISAEEAQTHVEGVIGPG